MGSSVRRLVRLPSRSQTPVGPKVREACQPDSIEWTESASRLASHIAPMLQRGQSSGLASCSTCGSSRVRTVEPFDRPCVCSFSWRTGADSTIDPSDCPVPNPAPTAVATSTPSLLDPVPNLQGGESAMRVTDWDAPPFSDTCIHSQDAQRAPSTTAEYDRTYDG